MVLKPAIHRPGGNLLFELVSAFWAFETVDICSRSAIAQTCTPTAGMALGAAPRASARVLPALVMGPITQCKQATPAENRNK